MRRRAFLLGGAAATPLLAAQVGGWARGGVAWANASDHPNLQAAIDALPPSGGTVTIPAGFYTAPPGGFVISKSVHLIGEPGVRLLPYSTAANQPVIRIAPGGRVLNDILLQDLVITTASRPAALVPGNYGIYADVPADGSKISNLVLDRVTVYNMGDDGIHLHAVGGVTDSFFVFVTLRNVQCTLGRHRGLYATVANAVSISNSFFNSNDDCGIRMESSELACWSCGFEDNCRNVDSGSGVNAYLGGQVYLRSCSRSSFLSCHWENFATAAQPVNKRGLTLVNSPGVTVSSCWFVNPPVPDLNPSVDPDPTGTQRGIYVTYGDTAGVMACTILPNRFDNVKTAIEIEAGGQPGRSEAKDCVIFPQFAASTPSSAQRKYLNLAGAMILPTHAADNGLVLVGGRHP